MRYTEINGVQFETVNTTKRFDNSDYLGRRTLLDYYDKPSRAKMEIWDDWCKWYQDCDLSVEDMRVTSANCFSFTIGAYYVNPETGQKLGYIRITRDHNYLYLYV